MTNTFNLDESNLFVVIKVEDLKAAFYDWDEEKKKKQAEAEREKEQKEWYNSRETAEYFSRSVSTINRWKKSGYLTARTIGGRDYYSKKEIELKMRGA